MTKVNLARKYRDEYDEKFKKQFPDGMPTKKLARIMYEENKLTFKDVEEARSYLRKIEGKAGTAPRGNVKLTHPRPERPRNPYKLPESDAETFEPFIMPFYERVLILNDIHLPYHDIPALTAAFDYGMRNEPTAIFLNGDVLDIHQLSFFERDPKKKDFARELDIFKSFMGNLQETFKVPIYFKFGNHEERYERFLLQKAKELVGVEEFELENIIKKRADCTIIKDKRIVDINGLPYVHGHEFGRGFFSPVNAARGLFLQAKHSCVKADCHTSSEHTEPDIFGKIMTTYSVGALCGLTPRWLPINKWNNGVAMQFNESESKYRLDNRRIYKGEII